MLGTRSKPKTDTLSKPFNGSSSGGDTCVISKGTQIDGQFNTTESMRLDGTINGEVKCESKLVVGEKGLIAGNVNTQDATIMGTIEGDIRVHGTLTLKGTALIRGGINAKYLVVEEGARYIGECSIGD